MQTVAEALERLQRSPFRARFHLGPAERAYAEARGMAVLESHARDFVRTRLAPAHPKNDGRQTPMRGHPVFVAQHACACCCRGCLWKWYRVRPGVPLTEDQQARIVRLLLAWIARELGAEGRQP